MRPVALGLVLCAAMFAQVGEDPAPAAPAPKVAKTFTLQPGTRLPLAFINSVSTKHSAPGDHIYLETAFPIFIDGRMVVPPGSYVMGTVTQVKRPGRVKGRGELYVRFDSLTLPNGTYRDFRARVSATDARDTQSLKKDEGKVVSDSGKGRDAGTVATGAGIGASIGSIAGSRSGQPLAGAGIGAAAGAAAGLVATLFTRGPDALLARGSVVEIELDRQLQFQEAELDFSKTYFNGSKIEGGPVNQQQSPQRSRLPLGLPF